MKELSRLTNTFSESVIREMTRICDSVQGYNLSQGFPDFDSPIQLKLWAIEAIINNQNQYPVTFGEPELREAIALKALRFNGIQCNPDTDITVTCGSTEAMIASLKAIINPDDEIIIFEPFYENYGPDVILSGATPKFISLKAPDWNFDMDELTSLFNEKTKAIIINTPNNPTGKVFTYSELRAIADLCVKWDVIAITDEIYEHIVYDGKKHISMASLEGMCSRTITINSISKTYAVTGWRVGWAIADSKITKRIRKVHDFFTVGAPTPFQHAAAKALSLDEGYYSGLVNHYDQAKNFLIEVLVNFGFQPITPSGAYYIMTDISSLKQKFSLGSDVDFTRELLNLTKVASVPGSSFFHHSGDGANYIRFTFCKKWETLYAVRDAFESAKG